MSKTTTRLGLAGAFALAASFSSALPALAEDSGTGGPTVASPSALSPSAESAGQAPAAGSSGTAALSASSAADTTPPDSVANRRSAIGGPSADPNPASAGAAPPVQTETAIGAPAASSALDRAPTDRGTSGASLSVAAPAPTKETVDNPYGIEALWKGSDSVTKGTLAILVLMSAASWFVIFTKLYEQSKLGRQTKAANRTFWSAGALPQALDTLHRKSAYHYIARTGIEAADRHHGLFGYIDLNTWISMAIQRTIERVQSRNRSDPRHKKHPITRQI